MREAPRIGEVTAACLLWLAGSSCADTTDQASITNLAGESQLDVRIDVAETASERALGLSAYEALDPNRGLLLVFPSAGNVCITNRDVPFPIDAIFISTNREVLHVQRALPASDPTIHCHPSTELVLEVPAGTAARVSEGDTFHLSI